MEETNIAGNERVHADEQSSTRNSEGAPKLPTIIGVVGLATHGKSTVAQRLRGLLPQSRILTLPFAKGVKDEAQRLGWNGLKDTKGRIILQQLGTEVCRNIDPDYWTKRWMQNAYSDMRDLDLIVCDDLRFDNELKCIKENGGYIIKIKRPMSLWAKFKRRVGLILGSVHASEVCFNDHEYFVDLIIENYWGMEAIDKQLEVAIEYLKLRDMCEVDAYIKETSDDPL